MYILLFCYRSRGGENRIKTDSKLAYKTVFVPFSTPGGRPMLLARLWEPLRSITVICPFWCFSMRSCGGISQGDRKQQPRCRMWTGFYDRQPITGRPGICRNTKEGRTSIPAELTSVLKFPYPLDCTSILFSLRNFHPL